MVKIKEERGDEFIRSCTDFFTEELKNYILRNSRIVEKKTIRNGEADLVYKIRKDGLENWVRKDLQDEGIEIGDLSKVIDIEQINQNLEVEKRVWITRGVKFKVKDLKDCLGIEYEMH